MGKASRWLRALLGAKKASSDSPPASEGPTKEKKKWGFVRSFNGNDRKIGRARGSYAEASSSSGNYLEAIDANKHAIAVAAATAAVAEAALAAAHAAAEVVRLTSSGGGGSRVPAEAYVSGSNRRREFAAVKIQSAFRAYLARRALRALKGLVRLQALVRGHIVRKQSADMLRRMQAMVRIQARACANRAHTSEPSHSHSKSSKSCQLGFATPKKSNKQLRAFNTKSDWSPVLKRSESKPKIKHTVDTERNPLGSNWLDRWMEGCSWNNQRDASLKTGHVDDERSDKILEVDTWKPHMNPKQYDRIFRRPQHVTPSNSLSRNSTKSQKQNPRIFSGEISTLRSLKLQTEADQAAVWTSENSPQVCSASSRPGSSGRRGPFTPARSECSRSFLSDYMGHPNYMANTESSLARVRSQSVPKQRTNIENFVSTKRFVRGFWNADTISEKSVALHTDFRTKANSGPVYDSRYGGRV